MTGGDRDQRAGPHLCPWWFIYSFDNPLRRVFQRPERILGGLVAPGDACLDIGCGMGYFTVPLARAVGPGGCVTAVDLQPKMLAGVARRASRCGVAERIRLFEATDSGWDLAQSYDLVLAFWMLHEVGDQEAFVRRMRRVLKPAGRLLVVEPKVHVTRRAFERSLGLAEGAGFVVRPGPEVAFSRSALLVGGTG